MIPRIRATLLCLVLALPTSGGAWAEWTLVSQNLDRFFDDRDDPPNDPVLDRQTYRKRIDQFAGRVLGAFGQPDIIAVQEVEKRAILQAVADRIRERGGRRYDAVLLEGLDPSGIDVGYLVASELPLRRLQSLFRDRRFRFRSHGSVVSIPLFARPPLLIEFCRSTCVTIVNLHLRSMRGLRSRRKGRRVALKRRAQAEALAEWVQHVQRTQPDRALVLVGDFNALTPSDRFVDVIGIIRGKPDQQRPRWRSPDRVDPDLIDPALALPAQQRYSYRYKRRPQRLDYLLLNGPAKRWLTQLRYGRIDYRFSDHAPLLARFAQP